MRKYQKDSTLSQISLGFSSSKTGFIRQLRQKSGAGFTLIELLVVIAILGVLATGLLVLINPLEKINQARDAGAIQSTKQLYDAAERYLVMNGQPAPMTGTNGQQALVDAGELKTIINLNGYPVYQVDTWTPDSTNWQTAAGLLVSQNQKQQAIKVYAAGGLSNCDGSQQNTSAYFNYKYNKGVMAYYCF